MKTDEAKVKAMNNLAGIYYSFQLNKEGDSILQAELNIAEFSENRELKELILFGSAIEKISSSGNSQSYNTAIAFVEKALNYAKLKENDHLVAIAYYRLSDLHIKKAEYDKGFEYANNAFITSLTVPDDSIKALSAMQVGNCYQAKSQSVSAFKYYSMALEKAEAIKNVPLQSKVLHGFSELYKSLDNRDLSKEYLLKSYSLNKKSVNIEGLINDNIDLARLTDDKHFVDDALVYAESIHSVQYILQAKRIMYGYYVLHVRSPEKTIKFINDNIDLKYFFTNQGDAFYFSRIGAVYQFSNQNDSALYYYKKAEPGLNAAFEPSTRMSLYEQMGQCYKSIADNKLSILYFDKALQLATSAGLVSSQYDYAENLGGLYEKVADYKTALKYFKQAKVLHESLGIIANQKDIALGEVTNARKKLEKEEVLREEKKIKVHNLEYMAITIVITALFFILLIFGMFTVSPTTIRIGGYFVFISLFEFIILLLETWIHKITHESPLGIWLFKICIILALVPFQHFLEHKLVAFLHTGKMAHLKNSLNIKNLLRKNKIVPVVNDETDDIDNSIL